MIIRPATPADAPAMAGLQAAIIALGGTTAHQHPKTADQVQADYIDGATALTCVVAEADGALIGFQAVGTHPALPEGWGDIGSYVRPGSQAKGIGGAMFAATRSAAKTLGLRHLNATIRADNVPGLAYYTRMGFVDYNHEPDWALTDGRKVGRISRRFDL